MKQPWIPIALCAVQAGLTVALGVAGVSLAEQFGLSEPLLLLIVAAVVVALLAVTVRVLVPPHPGGKDADALFVFPLHWSTLLPLGLASGLLLGLALVRFISARALAGTIHAYEIIGLVAGVLAVLAIGFGRNPYLGATFGIGYGLAFPSAVLLLEPFNDMALTYGGHLGVMVASAAIVIIFGRYVRIKIVG